MFDGCALPQQSATRPSPLEEPELALTGLVSGDRNCSAAARCSLSALRAKPACAACFGIEFDCRAWNEWFHLARGASDCLAPEVDLEVVLAEETGAVRPLSPRLREYRSA